MSEKNRDPAFLFNELEWKTNNTYDSRIFSEIPKQAGVYLIVKTDCFEEVVKHEILYIGSSKNLAVRIKSHEVYRILREIYGNTIRFYFREADNYLDEEKYLIKVTKARFNKQWR